MALRVTTIAEVKLKQRNGTLSPPAVVAMRRIGRGGAAEPPDTISRTLKWLCVRSDLSSARCDGDAEIDRATSAVVSDPTQPIFTLAALYSFRLLIA